MTEGVTDNTTTQVQSPESSLPSAFTDFNQSIPADVETEKNLYEVLSIPTHASKLMVRESYLRLKNLYFERNEALYSIMDLTELELMREQIEKAFQVLSDDRRRGEYDKKMGYRYEGDSQFAEQDSHKLFPVNDTTQQGIIKTPRSSLKIVNTIAHDSGSGTIQQKYETLLSETDLGDGELLRKLRDVAGVGEDELQERTKIALEYIRALEANRYDRLPQVVYVRGFLRSYLRYLKVPQLEKIVDAFALRFKSWQANQKT